MKVIAAVLSVLFYLCFGLALVCFHALQWLALKLFGYQAHKTVVVWLQFWLMRCTNILGTRYRFSSTATIPEGIPLILVANHQSMYDIPPLLWYFRKHHPKFISKKELGSGIPSVSYNLRHGGSVLIDRADPLASVEAINTFAKRVNDRCWSAVIFPEGTRSRNGKPKPFKRKGLLSLMAHIPDGVIIPITINNSWKLSRYGSFPMGLGAKVDITVHTPVDYQNTDHKTCIADVEQTITDAIYS